MLINFFGNYHVKKQHVLILQYTEEKLGGAEKTEYDPSFEALLRKADGFLNFLNFFYYKIKESYVIKLQETGQKE